MSLRSKRIFPVLAAVALAAAVFAAGCGSSGDSDESKNAAVVNAINILDNGGLHGFDESLNDDKTVPATAKATLQKLQAVTALTEWPDELSDEAEALEKIFADMVTALSGDNPDIAKAGAAATKAHDGEHEFSAKVWAHLYEEAGMTAEGAGH
jgi:hypothetical protein